MAIQLEGTQSFQHLPVRSEGAAGSQRQAGKLNGEGFVALSGDASKIANAAEEMSFVAKMFDNKKTDKRKLKSGSGLSGSILERIKKIQTIQGVQGVKDLLNNFQTQKNLTDRQIRDRLEKFSDDPVDQFTALDIAAEYFEELGDTAKAEKLRGLRDDIKANNETLIKAAENISVEAAGFSQFGDVRKIREDYVDSVESHADHVRDDKSLEKLHEFLTDNYGTDDVEEAIGMQLKLLSTDLAQVDPSAAPERLKAVVDDLSKLKQLVAMHDSCIEAEEQLARTYPQTEVHENVLMRQLLRIVQQQWVTEADFEQIPENMNVKELEPQIFTLTKVVAIVRMIPEEVFVNDETKQSIMAAATEGLESRIEEEAELEMTAISDDGDGILGELAIDVAVSASDAEGSGESQVSGNPDRNK